MSAYRATEVGQRLEQFENAGTTRLLESTLRPLAKVGEPVSTSETVSVPVDLLLTRFKNLDQAITKLNQKLRDQDDALRKKAALDWFRVAILIALTWAVTAGLPHVFRPSRTPEAKALEAPSAR
jgi:hypothetical protein